LGTLRILAVGQETSDDPQARAALASTFPSLAWRRVFSEWEIHAALGSALGASTQLTILAAAAVVPGEARAFTILRVLARNAQTNSRYRRAPRLRNFIAALRTVGQTRPLRQKALGTIDRILYGCVYLILYGAFGRPTRRHLNLPV